MVVLCVRASQILKHPEDSQCAPGDADRKSLSRLAKYPYRGRHARRGTERLLLCRSMTFGNENLTM
jgi:hypothetical protein